MRNLIINRIRSTPLKIVHLRFLFFILVTSLLKPFVAFSQTDSIQTWNAFSQSLDVTSYRGGEFRLKAFVRVESGGRLNNARLWARVDKEKGMGFFNNMVDRPITEAVWKQYTIQGKIDKHALRLTIGGLYFGAGLYYFDNFSVDVRTKGGEWRELPIASGDFETNNLYERDWKTMYEVAGYKSSLTSALAFDGTALMIDGSALKGPGQFVAVKGLAFYYETYGSSGDTVLLLHGNYESVKSFRKQIPELSKQFYVIAMDSRGQGYSSRDEKKMSYELMADDVFSFLETINMNRVNVLGWSDGGNIGLILAMQHPEKVKRLAIMGANLFNDNTSVEESVNKELRSQRARLIRQADVDPFRIEMIDLLLSQPRIDPKALEKIECPTLVMAGSDDVIKEGHTRLIAEKIRNSELVIFENGTHYEPLNNPERFNETVIDFFKERLK